MSVEAISRALNLAPAPPIVEASLERVQVFVGLTNHPGPDGAGAFPSVGTLLRYTRAIGADGTHLPGLAGGRRHHLAMRPGHYCGSDQASRTPCRGRPVAILHAIEYPFYYSIMSSLAPDRILVTPATGPATPPAPSGALTFGEEAVVAAELTRPAPVWVALLAECAGLALGYGEHQVDAARHRQIADLCTAAGVDQTLMEAWIEVGRQRASTAAASTHKACVLWDS